MNKTFTKSETGLPFVYAAGEEGYDLSEDAPSKGKFRDDAFKLISTILKTNRSLVDAGRINSDFSATTVVIGFALKDGSGDDISKDYHMDHAPEFSAEAPMAAWKIGESADGGSIRLSAKGMKKSGDTLGVFGLSKNDAESYVYLHELNHAIEFQLYSTGSGGRVKSGAWNDPLINAASRRYLGEALPQDKIKLTELGNTAKWRTEKWQEAYADAGSILMMCAGKGREHLEKITKSVGAWRETCGKQDSVCDASHAVEQGIRFLLDRFPEGVPQDIKSAQIDKWARTAADETMGLTVKPTNNPFTEALVKKQSSEQQTMSKPLDITPKN